MLDNRHILVRSQDTLLPACRFYISPVRMTGSDNLSSTSGNTVTLPVGVGRRSAARKRRLADREYECDDGRGIELYRRILRRAARLRRENVRPHGPYLS